jgi:hypothetical protein
MSPNPASNTLNISGDHADQVEIFDFTGKLIISGSGNVVDIEKLSQGIYIVKIQRVGLTHVLKFTKK